MSRMSDVSWPVRSLFSCEDGISYAILGTMVAQKKPLSNPNLLTAFPFWSEKPYQWDKVGATKQLEHETKKGKEEITDNAKQRANFFIYEARLQEDWYTEADQLKEVTVTC